MTLTRHVSTLTLFLLIHLPAPTKPTCNMSFSSSWQPSWANETRSDLHCSKVCEDHKSLHDTYEDCCTCHSCMNWEGKEVDLFIEYVSVLGRSLVLSDQAPSENNVYKIEHIDSEMTEIPSNLCNWDNKINLEERYPDEFNNIQAFWENIVKLNFKNNKIHKLPDLNCLVRLDEMNLQNNRLVYISNTSFKKLQHLRSLYFSGNLIQTLDPEILASPFQSIFRADFSHNEITKLDITNMMSLHPFCKFDFESNKITEMVNENGMKLNLKKTYGPGFVSLTNNLFQKWPDFKELFFLDDLSQIGKLFSFGFDFRGMPIICDCHLEPFMTLAKDIIEAIWLDYFNVTCTAPETLAGIPVYNVDPALFICPLPADSNCQTPECTCVDKPNEDTLLIDCSNAGLTRWPTMPDSNHSNFISLNISGNHLTKFENLSFLPKLSMLDISGNNIFQIDTDVAKLLENTSYLDISNNPNLRQLPQSFQYHNICSRNMENLQITCDCQSVWIEEWLKTKQCESFHHLFQCNIPDRGVKPARQFMESDLECYQDGLSYILEVLAGTFILILILTGAIIYKFRYEILIIYLRLRQRKRNMVCPIYKYDIFLSFNDTDDAVSKWVNKILQPNLAKAGYRVFYPSRDTAFGVERNSEMIKIIAKSRNFLTIMSESYFAEPQTGMCSWTENEWKYGWNNFKQDRCKNIVLINFDHVTSFDIRHLQIKAFLRVGCTVDFKNRDRNIMEEVLAKLQTLNEEKIQQFCSPNHKPHGMFVSNNHYK